MHETPSVRSSLSERPNVVVVVMDCVRAPEFSRGAATLDRMPFCSGLAHESVEFRRAVAPASWTIPSHASLFTGLYPWDHRLHSRGLTRLPSELPHLASELALAGYRTASFSSNPFVSDASGLTNAFQVAAWGGWWERYARHLRLAGPPGGRSVRATTPRGFVALRGRRLWSRTLQASRAALRFPLMLHTTNRALRSIAGGEDECASCVSPWIDEALDRWLAVQPAGEPVFAFVNLMEAHEPYMVPEGFSTWGRRWQALTLRQEFGDWLDGRWSPSADELTLLHELYVESIRALDHRIARIVGALRRANRWDDTAFLLTSDHGQSFGEEGTLSHGMSVGDAITHIPLWLRLPGGDRGGTRTGSWASLVDVVPTALRWAGRVPPGRPGGEDLVELIDRPRTRPAWSMAEGVIWRAARARLDPERLRQFDQVRIAAYLGNTRVTCSGNGEISTLHRPSDLGGLDAVSDATESEILEALRQHLLRLESWGVPEAGPSGGPVSRLDEWGYA